MDEATARSRSSQSLQEGADSGANSGDRERAISFSKAVDLPLSVARIRIFGMPTTYRFLFARDAAGFPISGHYDVYLGGRLLGQAERVKTTLWKAWGTRYGTRMELHPFAPRDTAKPHKTVFLSREEVADRLAGVRPA